MAHVTYRLARMNIQRQVDPNDDESNIYLNVNTLITIVLIRRWEGKKISNWIRIRRWRREWSPPTPTTENIR